MKLKTLIATSLLLISPLSVLGEQAKIETVGVSPKALFMLNDRIAVAALLEAGYQESYRGNLTAGFEIAPQHRVKLGGEYLLQHQEVSFSQINNRQVWVDQYATGLAYQFLPVLPKGNSHFALEASGYYAYTPDRKVTDSVRIAEANTYGTAAGFVAELPTKTLIDAKARYDNTRFINEFSDNATSEGFGFSGALTQPFTERVAGQIGADVAELYDNYYGSLNYLIPMDNMAFEIGVKGQYTEGKQGISDALAGFVTLALIGGPAPAPAAPGMIGQSLLDWTNTPAVYMPLVLAKADEALTAFIPDFDFNPGAGNVYDTSVFFTGSPVSFSFVSNPANPIKLLFNSSTGVITFVIAGGNIGPHASTVTASYADGSTITSNVFILTSSYP